MSRRHPLRIRAGRRSHGLKSLVRYPVTAVPRYVTLLTQNRYAACVRAVLREVPEAMLGERCCGVLHVVPPPRGPR